MEEVNKAPVHDKRIGRPPTIVDGYRVAELRAQGASWRDHGGGWSDGVASTSSNRKPPACANSQVQALYCIGSWTIGQRRGSVPFLPGRANPFENAPSMLAPDREFLDERLLLRASRRGFLHHARGRCGRLC
jgi:hypothetical protein